MIPRLIPQPKEASHDSEYLGHSSFKLTFHDGTVLVTDPYGSFYNYPLRHVPADICTVSHRQRS